MSNAIEDAVAARLATKSLGTVGTDIFTGGEKPSNTFIPGKSIFVLTSDGFQPTHYMGCDESYREVFVEVFIRDDEEQEQRCKAVAQQVIDEIDREYFPAFVGFVDCNALRSFPSYYGQNDDDQHIYHVRFKFGYIHTKVR